MIYLVSIIIEMTDSQQQNGPAAFGKIKKFDNGGRVIQYAFNVEDIKKFTVRNGKVYFKMNPLKEETQYWAKYLIREDDYMANYNNEWEGPLWWMLEWETPTKEPSKVEDIEVETDFKTWEVISAGKDTGLKPWDIYRDWKTIKAEDQNIDNLFA